MTLVFYPKSHRYRLDGEWVPGVTTLIKKGLPKPALIYWAAKSVAEFVADNEETVTAMRSMGRGPMVAALKAVPWQARDDKAARGTEVHALAERVAHGNEVDVPEYIAGHVQGYVDWLDKWQPEILYTECPVGNREYRYAGTFDAIMRLSGKTWLVDIKTSNAVYGDNSLQLAAYANAEFLLHNGAEIKLPVINRLGVLHVTEHGTTLYPVTDCDAAWLDFVSVLDVATAAERIDGYIGEELEVPV